MFSVVSVSQYVVGYLGPLVAAPTPKDPLGRTSTHKGTPPLPTWEPPLNLFNYVHYVVHWQADAWPSIERPCYYLQLMRGYLEKSHSKHVMPAHLQVLSALHFYNTGNQDDTRLCDNIQIAQTSFYHAVKEVRLAHENKNLLMVFF